MTNEELCERIRAGETDLLAQLIEQNHGIICQTAYRYLLSVKRQGGADLEDLVQTAAMGMIIAVSKWDSARGSFLTLAMFHMRRELCALVGIRTSRRRIENNRIILPLDVSINPDEENGMTFSEMIADENALDPLAACVNSDIHERIRKAVNALPPTIRNSIVRAYYYGAEWTKDKDERSRVINGIDQLKRNKDLKRLRRELCFSCYRHKGLAAFNTSWSSVVEDEVIRREKWREESERFRQAMRDLIDRSSNRH